MEENNNGKLQSRRQIYVRRSARMTKAQAKGYAEREKYLLDLGALHQETITTFPNILVEIGFGNGDVLAALARERPHWLCIGIDVYQPGIGALVNQCKSSELTNIRIVENDALTTLEAWPDHIIDLLLVLFPDPWPKARHLRRRLINSEFVNLVKAKLKHSGIVQVTTDWKDYAEQIECCMNQEFDVTGELTTIGRPKTRYELKGEKSGHQIWDLAYQHRRS